MRNWSCWCFMLLCGLLLSGCGGGGRGYEYSSSAYRHSSRQCAPYARSITGVHLSGNAAGWWAQAAGRYNRTHSPKAGDILVFRSSSRIPAGHVSVVRKVVDDRNILVEHANWRPGRIDKRVPVKDVSSGNNWTAVRVWWQPSRQMGRRVYATYGFIEP